MPQIERFFAEVQHFFAQLPNISLVLVNLLLGLVLMFWGYRLFRLWLLVLGAQTGYLLAGRILQHLHISENTTVLLVSILAALGFAIFYSVSLRLSFAMAGFSLGLLVARHYGGFFFSHVNQYVLLACGLVGALLAYFFVRLLITAGCAFYGTLYFTDSLYALVLNQGSGNYILTHWSRPGALPIVLLFLGLACCVLSFLFQYRSSHKLGRIRLPF